MLFIFINHCKCRKSSQSHCTEVTGAQEHLIIIMYASLAYHVNYNNGDYHLKLGQPHPSGLFPDKCVIII